MRRIILIGLATAALAAAPNANASEPIQLEHFAPVPCAVACAYWDGPAAAGFNECANPFPAGSYDVTKLRLTSSTGIARFEATSVVDYDSFLCTTNAEPLLIPTCGRMQKCSTIGNECSGVGGIDAIAVGCTETFSLNMHALHAANGGLNDEFLLISYNWADHAALSITATGPVEVLDDTYEAIG